MTPARAKPQDLDRLAQNLRWVSDAELVARRLATEGIDLVALKGLGLLLTVYRQNEHRRSMSDLDLWCRREDEPAVRAAFESEGYQRLDHLDGCYVRRVGERATYLDLHTEVAPWAVEDLEALWTRTFAVPGSSFRVLSIEDQIILTAHHAVARHAQIRESWARDLHELLTCSHDPALVIAEARRLDVLETVRVALEMSASDSRLTAALRSHPSAFSPRGMIRRRVYRAALRGPEIPARARIATLLTTARPLSHLYRLILPAGRELAGRHGGGSLAARRFRRLRSLAERAVQSVRRSE